MAEVFIENLGELKEAFEKIVDDVKEKFRDKLHEAVEEVCQHVEATAKDLCPERTGALRESISHTVTGTYGRVFTGSDPTYYGHMVHFGSIHNEADPFLYKASERHASEIQQLVQKIADGDLNE
jgi:HK97 gp10 family phage protein